MKDKYNRNFCVAPMMGYTTPYARNLYRILSKKTFLFTEMIASKSLIHSKNNLIILPKGKKIILKGINNYIIVEKNNTLLIYPKSKDQEIGKL